MSCEGTGVNLLKFSEGVGGDCHTLALRLYVIWVRGLDFISYYYPQQHDSVNIHVDSKCQRKRQFYFRYQV